MSEFSEGYQLAMKEMRSNAVTHVEQLKKLLSRVDAVANLIRNTNESVRIEAIHEAAELCIDKIDDVYAELAGYLSELKGDCENEK